MLLNKCTKVAKRYIEMYQASNMHTLNDCYSTCSIAKRKAEAACYEKMYNSDGHDFKILSYNSNFFTCGWRVNDSLHVETYCNSYIIRDCL